MTTVAWDGKTLAADRQVSDSGCVFQHVVKLHRIPDGFIACAGDVIRIHAFVEWVRAGMRGKPPAGEREDGVDAILVKSGKVYYVESCVVMERDRKDKLAVGSGWMWAMAAMDHGGDAIAAVAYACTRDTGSGGGVDYVRPFGRSRRATYVRPTPETTKA